MKVFCFTIFALYIAGFIGMKMYIYKRAKKIRIKYIKNALKYAFVYDMWCVVQIYRFFKSLYYANKPFDIGKY